MQLWIHAAVNSCSCEFMQLWVHAAVSSCSPMHYFGHDAWAHHCINSWLDDLTAGWTHACMNSKLHELIFTWTHMIRTNLMIVPEWLTKPLIVSESLTKLMIVSESTILTKPWDANPSYSLTSSNCFFVYLTLALKWLAQTETCKLEMNMTCKLLACAPGMGRRMD